MFNLLLGHIAVLPQVQKWPELNDIFEKVPSESKLPFWKYPLVVSRAAGNDEFASYPAAALLCLSTGINLIDDLLDEEFKGGALGLDAARSANLAAALHVAALEVVRASPIPSLQKDQCLGWISSAGIDTASGQDLDVISTADDEDGYWQIVEAKSQPLVRAAFALGGIVAGCEASTVESLASIGELLGRIIQLQDDLGDALAEPRQQDWQRPSHNLAILYAMTADHPERDRFHQLLRSTDSPSDLREAQSILTRSGGVAYCLFHVVQLFRRVGPMTRDLPLADRSLLLDFLRQHVLPIEGILRNAGLEAPEQLWNM